MVTAIEDSNLAHIGSPADRAAKKAAAECEGNWSDAGKEPGLQIWRVENTRDANGNPKFGINPWPVSQYGRFHTGDSYIILHTMKDDSSPSSSFIYDLYFWIGSESTQDEYGVAAYKACELDDLLGDAPVQYREVQYYESDKFVSIFPSGTIVYLKGGVDSGFRSVEGESNEIDLPSRLFHVRKNNGEKSVRVFEVELNCSSMNHGDAFVLDAGKVIYTWYGEQSSPFEKSKASMVANNLSYNRTGYLGTVEDVGNENDDFWSLLKGSKGSIKEADDFKDDHVPKDILTKMYILTEQDSFLKVKAVDDVSMKNLVSDDVCMVDTGKVIYVWIGKGSTPREQRQAMVLATEHARSVDRSSNTNVVRVMEGQERRIPGFSKAFK
jgi:hypothetical protein